MSCRNSISPIHLALLFLLAISGMGCVPVDNHGVWNQMKLAIAGGSIQLQTPQPLPIGMESL